MHIYARDEDQRYPDLYVKRFSSDYREYVVMRAATSMRCLQSMLDAISGTCATVLADHLVDEDARLWLKTFRQLRTVLRDGLSEHLREASALLSRMHNAGSEFERNECCAALLSMIDRLDGFVYRYGNLLLDSGISLNEVPQVLLRGSVH